MRLVNINCPGCGALMLVDPDAKQATCQFCDAVVPIDDEAMRFQFDNAAQAGYEFEKGRQRARAEYEQQQQAWAGGETASQAACPTTEPMEPAELEKKRKTWLWVLGWIFIFPVPLTILMLNHEEWDKKLRYAAIVAGWLVYLAIVA